MERIEVIRTRGGLHLLINLENDFLPKNWHSSLLKPVFQHFTIISNGDGLTPIPGCSQGGYSPRLL